MVDTHPPRRAAWVARPLLWAGGMVAAGGVVALAAGWAVAELWLTGVLGGSMLLVLAANLCLWARWLSSSQVPLPLAQGRAVVVITVMGLVVASIVAVFVLGYLNFQVWAGIHWR